MTFTRNACAEGSLALGEKMGTMGVGGTRLQIYGTESELKLVTRALELLDRQTPRKSHNQILNHKGNK
jgi:hypothetical protein